MPSLYGGGNTAANVNVGSTTSLYQGSGSVTVLNNAQTLYLLLSNSGNVQFALDGSNTHITANALLSPTGVAAGTYGSTTEIPQFTVMPDGQLSFVQNIDISSVYNIYGNANVAAYLPIYSGTLDASSTILNLWANAAVQDSEIIALVSNAASQQGLIVALQSNAALQEAEIISLQSNAAAQQGQIDSTSAELTSFEIYANLHFGDSNYSNVNVAAYLPTYTGSLDNSSSIVNLWANAATQAGQISGLQSNAASQEGEIITLQSNAATQQGQITSLQGNAATQQGQIDGLTSNAAAQDTQILNLWANAAIQQGEITSLQGNAASQQGQINTLSANLGGFETWANANFSTTTYSNTNVAAYLPGYSGSMNSVNALTAHTVTGGNISLAGDSITTLNDEPLYIQAPMIMIQDATVSSEIMLFSTNVMIHTGGIAEAWVFNVGGNLSLPLASSKILYPNGVSILDGLASTYGNANVAAYLPTYSGSLDNSSSVINLWSNAASQQSQISTLLSNAASQQTQINNLVSNSSAQESEIITLQSNAATQQGLIDGLTSNAASQDTQIVNLWANAATQQGQITSLQSNAASQEGEISSLQGNAATQQGQIDTLSANLGGFETWANLNFSTTTYSNANVDAYLPVYSGNISAGNLTLTNPLPISSGGTGQTTKSTAFDALSPLNSVGDLLIGGASGTGTRLGIGTANQVLHGGASSPSYSAVTEADISLSAVTTNNATTSRHGFLPVLPNNASQFLNGQGNFTTPSGLTIAASYLATSFSGSSNVHVIHNFGTFPIVQVIDSTGNVLIPDSINNPTSNDFYVSFASSTTGTIVSSVGAPQPQSVTIVAASTYTVLTTDRIVKVTASGCVVTLPTSVGSTGREFNIVNASLGSITVNTTSSQTINAQLTQVIPSYSAMTVFADGSNYWII